MRYITRMFKAGILSAGELTVNDEGVVQGSCCSPVIANIVAHYVIDLWITETVSPLMRGRIKLFRYCDDLVICCRYKEDAKRIFNVLGKRLDKYHLALNGLALRNSRCDAKIMSCIHQFNIPTRGFGQKITILAGMYVTL
jgi:RNA-directed DNA polymerase